MKNIHILPTDKPSRLSILNSGKLNFGAEFISSSNSKAQNIYITSDEVKKHNEWVLSNLNEVVRFCSLYCQNSYKKIILTTDQNLIKDGVQAIDDEFLEWFVKNPSCEEVELFHQDVYSMGKWDRRYKIIIPKEEPKQETLEEAAGSCAIKENRSSLYELGMKYFIEGAKWQQDKSKQKRFIADEVGQFQFSRPKMYSEEEIFEIFDKWFCYRIDEDVEIKLPFSQWFKQFKKK